MFLSATLSGKLHSCLLRRPTRWHFAPNYGGRALWVRLSPLAPAAMTAVSTSIPVVILSEMGSVAGLVANSK